MDVEKPVFIIEHDRAEHQDRCLYKVRKKTASGTTITS